MPKAERQYIEQKDEIHRFLEQSNISEKNVARLKTLCEAENERIARLAALVLRVAEVKPHRRKRLKFLASHDRELLHQLVETGLICEDEAWLHERAELIDEFDDF